MGVFKALVILRAHHLLLFTAKEKYNEFSEVQVIKSIEELGFRIWGKYSFTGEVKISMEDAAGSHEKSTQKSRWLTYAGGDRLDGGRRMDRSRAARGHGFAT